MLFVDPERSIPEENEYNNVLLAGVEVGQQDIRPVGDRRGELKNWDDLVSELRRQRPHLMIHGSVDDGALDGLERSFVTTGKLPHHEGYEEFVRFVALGRVFAFDVATSVLARLPQPGEWAEAQHMLDVYRAHILRHEDNIGDEIIVDFFSTTFDQTPFNPDDDPDLIQGVSGNVSSVIHAYAAYRYVTGDTSFDDFLERLLFGRFERGAKKYEGLLDRQAIEPGSPLHGLFLSRPEAHFEPDGTRFAILENNLRAHDALRFAVEVISAPELKAELIKRYQLLHNALRREFVNKAPHEYTEAIDENGPVSNKFDSQDLYTIGGIFLLREGEVQKARQVLDYLDEHFIVGHRPGDDGAVFYNIASNPHPTCHHYPNAGVPFFVGFDEKGDLTGKPIDFGDPKTNRTTEKTSSQSEAVLDYMLFVFEYATTVPDPVEQSYAMARFDLMANAASRNDPSGNCGASGLYNWTTDVGLLPNSTRVIPNLFTDFDAALGTNEAIVIDLILKGMDPERIYRGPILRSGPAV